MKDPVHDDDYAEDDENTVNEDLPEPTDPSVVPPDQGDTGRSRA